MLDSIISRTRLLTLGTGVFGAAAALIATFAFTPAAFAQAPVPPNGYVQSLGGTVKSGFGLCWRTGYWTPQMATQECDPDLVPKKAAPAPASAARAAAAQAPAAPKAVMEKITLRGDTLFDFDKTVIKPEGKQILDRLVEQARTVNLEVIVAVGHADWVGSDAYNQKLSERRAESVKAYLVSKGFAAARVYTEGKGEKQPVADNNTAEGRAKNRRVEVEVIGTRAIK